MPPETSTGPSLSNTFLLDVTTLKGQDVSIFQRQLKHTILTNIPVLLLLATVTGCATVNTENGDWVGFTESGQASFYADKHQNQLTANGERYKHNLNTAAHKKLPFGSTVKVTNVKNGKSVVVRINDRGPFVRGRIIDLSKSAFSRIGATSSGLLKVDIEVIE